MPRKRRRPKKLPPLPQGLAQISLCERSYWAVYGPTIGHEQIEGNDPDGPQSHVWPDWKSWTTFYASVRDEFHGDRPWLCERSAAERLYRAWLRGEDCDSVQSAILAELHDNDPRRMFGGAYAS